jgi:hypothetical protein
MAPTWNELEAIWRRNEKVRRRLKGSRPHRRGLRGPDLVGELIGLAGLTYDHRFDDCINALFEHQIVNPLSHEFTDGTGPLLKQRYQIEDDECVAQIRARMKDGVSEWRACSEVAAASGRGAANFRAAAEQLKRTLHPKARTRAGRR